MAANSRHHPTIWTRFVAILLASCVFSACQDEPDAPPTGWKLDAGADAGEDIGGDVQDAGPPGCTAPDPSLSCVDTGCEQGFACVETSGCAPSSCFCESDRWSCTEDCGQSYACQPLEGCRALDDANSCESAGCDWRYAGACAEPSSGAVLEQSGCFVARECTSNAECDDGESCQPVAIKPDCAVGYPNEPVCDACMMMVTMCY